ncbi:hypothetical protein [Dechloromonas denitrificans]|nr:hypothetical protein [Dechloromonas denitrificans]
MENEDLAELPPVARLLFVYLWMLADREGRLEDRPKRIAGRALPYDREVDVDDLLNQLVGAGFITRYTVGEMALIQIINFAKHQSPHVRETASELPGIEQGTTKEVTKHNLGSAEASPRSPDSLFPLPDSLLPGSDADASVVASNSLAPCPQQEILGLYANELPDLAQPRVWNGAREKNLRNRWAWVLADLKKKDKPHDKTAGLVFFQRMFAYIGKSDLLMGRSGKWSASLPWIVEAENFAKIIEGNYENREAA